MNRLDRRDQSRTSPISEVVRDKINPRFDDYAKRIFGPSTTISGSIGTVCHLGRLEIRIDGRTLGTGGTFASALVDASRRIGYPSRPCWFAAFLVAIRGCNRGV